MLCFYFSLLVLCAELGGATIESLKSGQLDELDEFAMSDSKFLEVTYVVDQYAIDDINSTAELYDILMTVGNMLSRIFYDRTLGEIKVTVVTNKIVLASRGEFSYGKSASTSSKLRKITQWAVQNNSPDDTVPEHSDVTVLITSHSFGGIASMGSLCKHNGASVVVSLKGLATAYITAHEFLHSFGCDHDGSGNNKNCINGEGLMSTHIGRGSSAYVWSECSKQCAQTFLRSEDSSCLNDAPSGASTSHTKLPGEMFDADKQCELLFGKGWARCIAKESICSSMFCSKNQKTCSYNLVPPADGTRCGSRNWCISGECVDDGSPKIHGNWGEWSNYSSCSRPCGGGVQHRTRLCDSPSPQNGGMTCQGSNIGQYRVCNKQACPDDALSFRTQQCKNINSKYIGYLSATKPCSLFCRVSRKWRYHGNVEDGTRCTNDVADNDVCVNGKCESVGCDDEYQSGKEMDRCAVCDGDGSTCVPRKATYTSSLPRKFGNKYPFPIITLKKGSAKIHVTEKAPTYNYIGILNEMGEYLIRIPTLSKTVYKAGTKITYVRKRSKFKDEVIIPGPLSEDLQLVFVRKYERMEGIDISYYEPVANSNNSTNTAFVWKPSNWSECSKECAGGAKYREVECCREDDMSHVGDRFCSINSRPEDHKICNTHDCPHEWLITPWEPCSRTCGRGVQKRMVMCGKKNVDDWIVLDDSECAGLPREKQLQVERFCNEITCWPEYVTSPWSKCSTTCRGGTRTREVKCEMINKHGEKEALPMEACAYHDSVQPTTTENCNDGVQCGVPNYALDGCYRDSYRRRYLPLLLKNLRSTIDWHNPAATIEECARIAHERNKVLFAIQFYSECWSHEGNTPSMDYTALGVSKKSWSGLGKSWTNCVYRFLPSA